MHELIAKHQDQITGTLSGFAGGLSGARCARLSTPRGAGSPPGGPRSAQGLRSARRAGEPAPEGGLPDARIQTWLPFPVQICLRGREWPARHRRSASPGRGFPQGGRALPGRLRQRWRRRHPGRV